MSESSLPSLAHIHANTLHHESSPSFLLLVSPRHRAASRLPLAGDADSAAEDVRCCCVDSAAAPLVSHSSRPSFVMPPPMVAAKPPSSRPHLQLVMLVLSTYCSRLFKDFCLDADTTLATLRLTMTLLLFCFVSLL
ncbi:uncharacterized protein [Spinacia oleracea]|uniref:Uncharacterized protein n=1 Tax=Spinacia oleracea TaxID=3562 RepID=A0A9R0IY32_SPIOL|nr:uncharacterized protein LOC110795677 [Spinacia oleracea]